MNIRRLTHLAILFTCIAATTSPAFAKDHEKNTISVHDAWSIPTFKGATVGVGYFTVTNNGKEDDTLLSASTPAAGMAELHENITEQDMISMKRLEKVVIPAGQTISFAPGKMHLMLMMLKKPLALGDRFSLTLTFEKAGKINTSAKVVDKQRLAR